MTSPGRTLLLVSGSLRGRSTNSAALRTLAALAPETIECHLYEGSAALPHFNPDHDEAPGDEVETLRTAIRTADAIVFSTPEYAGALPSPLKNVLEWAVGDGRAGSIYEKPVAWLNVSSSGAALAHASLRTILGYVNARVVEEACVHVPVSHGMVGDEGRIADPTVGTAVRAAVGALVAALDRAP